MGDQVVHTGRAALRAGLVAELQVAAQLTAQGAILSFPPGDAPYDLVVDFGHGVKRVQVKLARLDERLDRWRFNACRGRADKRAEYGPNEFDLYAVVLPNDVLYIHPQILEAKRPFLSDEHLALNRYPDGF